jgi:type II secretory pathway component GspD/PulD (secretin)
MDAPLAPISYTLFDPMIEGTEPRENTTFPVHSARNLLPISGQFRLPIAAQQVQPNYPPMPQPVRPGPVVPPAGTTTPGSTNPGEPGATAPRGIVTAYELPGLGLLALRAENAQDLKIVLDLIEYLRELSKAAQPRIQVVTLEYLDCNYAADLLTTFYSRVLIAGPQGTYLAQPTQQGFGAPGGFGAVGAQQAQNRGVYFLALPQLNSMLVVGPEARFDEILKEIRKIDVPNSEFARPKPFRLKKASAQIVATQLQTFFNSRFPGYPQTKNQFRITYDAPSNTVWVQASRADLEDVAVLIEDWDSTESGAVNDVRIFPLRNADALGLAQVLTNALSVHVVSPLPQQTFSGPVVQTAGGTSGLLGTGLAGGAFGGGAPAAAAGLPGGAFGGGAPAAGGVGAAGSTNVQVQTSAATLGSAFGGSIVTRSSSLRFIYGGKEGETAVVSGLLSDVHLVPNVRTNSIIVAAPEKTMKLIAMLIEKLDTPPSAAAFVQIFTLRNAEANLTANLLRSLFTGQTTGTGTGGGGGGGAGATAGGVGATAGGSTSSTQTRPILSDGGDISPGATLVGLQIAVDDRTNSLVVAGAQNDVEVIRGIIAKLDASDTPDRYYDVFKLRNAAAADVATALTSFISSSLGVLSATNFYSTYIQLQKNVVIVAEPVSNTVLISATPFYFMEMKRIIERIDAQPPQVVIQVLIASVQLNNDEEFGIQVGLQSPVLFARSGLATATTSGTATNAASPGFLFNSTTSSPSAGNLGNSSLTSPGQVGFQSLSNLGVGTTSPTQGVGGFVFQASSQSFSLLIRALKAQGRIDVLSRPQVTVADNQTGYVQVGANYPYLSTSTVTGTGLATQSIAYNPIGVTMRVTPRVNPDGKVLMRVEPQVASVSAGPVSLGNGILAPEFNISTVQTTVLASDGETIILGGLVSKQDTRSEVGIPFMKDIPYVGALFRYRQHTVARQEVIVIMTPHIVRSEADQARILAEEVARMHSCIPDYARIHGHGMEVIGPATLGARVVPTNPLAPGGGYFNAQPPSNAAPQYGPANTSGPAYFGDIQRESIPADPIPGTVRPGGISLVPQQQYYQAPNGQPIYSNAGPLPGSNGQPQFIPGMVQVQGNPPLFNPSTAQPPLAAPYVPVSQPGAATQPNLVPGVPMPPGTPTTSAPPGASRDWLNSPVATPSLASASPAQVPVNTPRYQPVTPVTQASGSYPAQPMYANYPSGPMAPMAPQGPPPGPSYRMEMPNGQSPPASPRYPDLAPGISGPDFMKLQPQTAPQPKPNSNGTPISRNSDVSEGIYGSGFMQPQQQIPNTTTPAQ